ncbi:MAG TPA: hypothetical protein VFY89_00680 [Ktedonobacterales bacterium]
MAMIESALANALNALLEEERASVEMEVALASGATQYLERQALAAMGGDDLDACCELHVHLERLGVMISRRIHGAVYIVLNEERYDARLRAFAHHQRMVGAHAEALLEAGGLDRELRRILTELRDAHVRHSLWCEGRADEFAATRAIDFRTPAGRAMLRRPVGGAPPGALADAPPEADVLAEAPEPGALPPVAGTADVEDASAARDPGDVQGPERTRDASTEEMSAEETGELPADGEHATATETPQAPETSDEAPGIPLRDMTYE